MSEQANVADNSPEAKKKSKAGKGTKNETFEDQLKKLEMIVENLEKGELPLEESLSQFEKGVKLTRECQQLLNQAQQKVAILTQGDEGEQLQEFSKD
ncbi:exodeoxyribonuclease VII small subunit [Aliikangiella coralliicola]|uniref:Exodeoxyribonuclease 7 small subunit n=1 Tax=Aliikangiella coralliicola TaxID=2592383 RepID=A0A545U7W7_9GAMM|nr:exodeoxyribonuclease VII small subunit [Aliikangiella coralliicola]TQV85565.1 exodeoxyribonuclease VII small subunit [Aliikangiella coralliicola]